MKLKFNLIYIVTIISLTTACSRLDSQFKVDNPYLIDKEQKEQSSQSQDQNNSEDDTNSGNSDNQVQDPVDIYQDLKLSSKISGGPYDKTTVIDLDRENDALLLILPLAINPYITGIEAEVKSIPGARFKIYENVEGVKFFAISIPFTYILRGAKFLPDAKLPSGDALPSVAAGELPSTHMIINSNKDSEVHIYLGVNQVAIFVSTPFNPYIQMTYPIKNDAQTKTVGYFNLLPKKGAYNGGFYLTTALPLEIAQYLDDHF